MARLPFVKFFPNDWLAEPTIRVCSVAARGLWMDMLSLMHLSPRRGYLLAASGSPLSPEQLARLTGCSADEVTRLLAELKSSGVFSCTEDGIIFNRRMVRDEGKREKCADAGRRGGLMSARGRTLEGQVKGGSKGPVEGEPKPPEARGHFTVPSEQSGVPPRGGGGKETRKRGGDANPSHAPAVRYFTDTYLARRGRKYAFARGKDADAVAWVLSQVGNDLAEFRATVDRYLASDDPFVAKNGHDLGTLRLKLNAFLPPATLPFAPVVKRAADNPMVNAPNAPEIDFEALRNGTAQGATGT